MTTSVKRIITGTLCAVTAAMGIGEGTVLASAKTAQNNSIGQVTVSSVASTKTASTKSTTSRIGVSKAKKIALKNAGLKSSSVTFTKAKLDKEDNVYDIEFKSGSKKYEYEIGAKSGKVVSKEVETIKTKNTDTKNNQKSTIISASTAKAKALKKAGLKASNVKFTKAKLDREDGRQIYEIEFIKGRYEYEVEIDALTGKVLDYSREIND